MSALLTPGANSGIGVPRIGLPRPPETRHSGRALDSTCGRIDIGHAKVERFANLNMRMESR